MDKLSNCSVVHEHITNDINPQATQKKRKEKARIAARARRSQEANIITEMAKELHITRRIDKATIVKLAIDYIKAFEILCRFRHQPQDEIGSSSNEENSSSSININSSNNNNCNINRKSTPTTTTTTTTTATTTTMTTNKNNHTNNHTNKIINSNTIIINNENIIINNNNNNNNNIYKGSISNSRQQMNNIPKLNTTSIFAPKTNEVNSYFLMIGDVGFVFKSDNDILEEDDLTHLAPQAGDMSISLEADPLDDIVIDPELFENEIVK